MRAGEAGLNLKLEAPASLPPVYADRQYIVRAIENLVGNAVAYTPRGGEVTIKAELEGAGQGACIVVTVSDTGPGITPEDQAKVFDKYYRAATAGEVRGSGLGLAIVKAVADAHGASVSLDSSPGIGSTFRLCMPVKSGR
jgi:signal transduction histidine kinase